MLVNKRELHIEVILKTKGIKYLMNKTKYLKVMSKFRKFRRESLTFQEFCYPTKTWSDLYLFLHFLFFLTLLTQAS